MVDFSTIEYTYWEPGMKKEKVFIDWSTIEFLVDQLTTQIRKSGKQYDAVVGVLRGGLVPAVMLSHRLDLPLYVVRPDSDLWDEDNHYLIVDEIYDTGKTIDQLKTKHPNADFAVLYHNSNLPPLDFYATKQLLNKWLVFPWEKQE
jgi:hypoxanthine phosphoribosyltransferase